MLRFLEVGAATEWSEDATLLHLKETLRDEAPKLWDGCHLTGIARSIEISIWHLPLKDRMETQTLEKETRSSLQEYGIEVQ